MHNAQTDEWLKKLNFKCVIQRRKEDKKKYYTLADKIKEKLRIIKKIKRKFKNTHYLF